MERMEASVIGERFGRLTVIRDLGVIAWPGNKRKVRRLECLCDCGNTVTPSRQNLVMGHIRSCGCLALEVRPIDDRFWEKVEFIPFHSCWEWVGCINSAGYGQLKVGQRNIQAHHVSWFLRHGVWPKQINHHCDNRPCVRPEHLYEGTQAENMRDVAVRLRLAGERRPDAKLTNAKVIEIRELVAAGISPAEIATRFGIKRNTVRGIARHARWSHIGGPLAPRIEHRKMTPARAAQMRALYAEGVKGKALLERFPEIRPTTAYHLLRGRTYRNLEAES